MDRLRFALALALIFALAALGACGGDDDDGDPPGAPTAPGSASQPTSSGDDGPPGSDSRLGSCDVEVTGDIEVSFSGPGGASAFGTDYWMSESELRGALEFLVGIGEELTDEEKEAEIDRILSSGEVVLFLFLMNCDDPAGENYIGLFPGGEATYDDVPFAPASYTIAAGGVLGGNPGPHEFSALITLDDPDGGESLHFGVLEPGIIDITLWDESHIAGTFSFKAREGFATGTPREVEISGEFDLRKP